MTVDTAAGDDLIHRAGPSELRDRGLLNKLGLVHPRENANGTFWRRKSWDVDRKN